VCSGEGQNISSLFLKVTFIQKTILLWYISFHKGNDSVTSAGMNLVLLQGDGNISHSGVLRTWLTDTVNVCSHYNPLVKGFLDIRFHFGRNYNHSYYEKLFYWTKHFIILAKKGTFLLFSRAPEPIRYSCLDVLGNLNYMI